MSSKYFDERIEFRRIQCALVSAAQYVSCDVSEGGGGDIEI